MARGVSELFDLQADQESPDVIDERIRAGARVHGTNLWVLFFAMLVASVGLNVNSTAVIIGAMLISPLMGPIVGIGYGVAVNDVRLIASAAQNLGIFSALSLLVSTAYFWLSPLAEPGSELLARTTPNLWDVLIAAFGGAAGMVGATRRGFTNVVPGVAIATALMPPLCTAGFGLAHGRWDLSSGAIYLFLINGVFIAASTLAVTRVLRLPSVQQLDDTTSRRASWAIAIGLLLVLGPAVWQGVRFVRHELFASHARAVVRALQSEPESSVVTASIDAAAKQLELTVVGAAETERQPLERTRAMLESRGVTNFQVTTRRVGAVPDAGELRRQIDSDVTLGVAQRLSQLEARLQDLQERAARDTAPPGEPAPSAESLLTESQALEPSIRGLAVLTGVEARAGTGAPTPATVFMADVPRPLAPAAHARLQTWLRQRTRHPDAALVETAMPPAR